MRKLFSIGFLLLMHSSLKAQKPAGQWFATLTGAFVPLPEFNVGIQPGLGYRLSDRFSILTEVTIRLGNKADKDSEAVGKQFFRVQPELRYHLSGKKRKQDTYAGFRCSYSIRKFADMNKGFYATEFPGDEGFYYDYAKISSPVITTSLQFGSLFPAGKKISIDIFAGVGARFIKTEYSDIINPVAGIRPHAPDGPAFYASYSYQDNITWLHLNGGLRFVYHFRE